MSETMRERMARAGHAQAAKAATRSGLDLVTWEDESDHMKAGWLAITDAMLDALRDPSEDMLDAGHRYHGHGDEMLTRCWTEMIDAAKAGQ